MLHNIYKKQKLCACKLLSSSEFNAIIYRNIGMEFHPIVSALNLRSEPVPFSELYSQLLSHEILLKSYAISPSAHLAFRPTSSSPRPPAARPNFNKRKCQICGYFNHTADRCRRRYAPHQNVVRPQANFTTHNSSLFPMSASSYPTHATAAYSAHYPTPPLAPLPPPAQWIPDSGATHHMTSALHHLQ